MATEESTRLDRLEGLAETLLQIAQQQQTQSIRHEGEIGDLRQSTETLLQIAQQQQTQSIRHEGEIEDLKQSVADLRVSTSDLRASTADVVSMIGTLANQQSEIAAEVRGLQLESRRILDYLFNQQGGGES